jgi:hypothetical protein
MIKYLVKHHKPEILVITPLLTGHKVSKECKKTLKRNKTPFEWITYMGPGNPCKNSQLALNKYKGDKPLPPYIIKIDNDIICQRRMLDTMKSTLDKAPDKAAYCYCSFEFRGAYDISFPAIPFDIDKLRHTNYISSCSLMDTEKFLEVGQWITNNEGFRLLDWALWLKYLKHGYIGEPTTKTSFMAATTERSVSAGSNEEYHKKKAWVIKNFG